METFEMINTSTSSPNPSKGSHHFLRGNNSYRHDAATRDLRNKATEPPFIVGADLAEVELCDEVHDDTRHLVVQNLQSVVDLLLEAVGAGRTTAAGSPHKATDALTYDISREREHEL